MSNSRRPSSRRKRLTILFRSDEGRQIYFGRCDAAKKFFTDMGFSCPERQTTADFLTSLTSELERIVEPGFEKTAPRTPDEFVERWKASQEYKNLIAEIDEYNQTYQIGGEYLAKFQASRKAQQSRGQRISSPYTLSYMKQVKLCVWRGFRRLIGNPEITLTALIGESSRSCASCMWLSLLSVSKQVTRSWLSSLDLFSTTWTFLPRVSINAAPSFSSPS